MGVTRAWIGICSGLAGTLGAILSTTGHASTACAQVTLSEPPWCASRVFRPREGVGDCAEEIRFE
jgi:hypothetical protein